MKMCTTHFINMVTRAQRSTVGNNHKFESRVWHNYNLTWTYRLNTESFIRRLIVPWGELNVQTDKIIWVMYLLTNIKTDRWLGVTSKKTVLCRQGKNMNLWHIYMTRCYRQSQVYIWTALTSAYFLMDTVNQCRKMVLKILHTVSNIWSLRFNTGRVKSSLFVWMNVYRSIDHL